MNNTTIISLAGRALSILPLLLFQMLSINEGRAAAYIWTGVSEGLWSSASNWSPSGGPPTAGDTASILSPGASLFSISYDASASGTLANLIFTNTSGAAIQTLLELNRDLTLTSGTSLMYATVSGSTVRLQLNGSSSLTIDSDAVLEIGVNSTSEQAYYTVIKTGSGYTGLGTIIKGELKLINGVSGSAGFTIQGAVTVESGGTLTAQGNTGVESPTFTGNFTTLGTSTLRATTVGSSTPTNSKFVFQGAVNSFSAGTTFTGIANATTSGYYGATGLIFNPTASVPNQSLTMGVVQDFAVLNSTAQLSVTETFTSTAAGNGIGAVFLDSSVSGTSVNPTKTTFKLGSDLTYAGSLAASPFTFSFNSKSNITQAIDLNGFSYDSGVKSFAPYPSGGSAGAGTNFVQIINSGVSSLSGGDGIFKAVKFVLTQSGLEVGIGNGVILQATGSNSLNDLGHGAGGQSVDAGSVFYYTGAGASALKSNRSIGGITVGTTAGSGSALELSSNIVAGGVTTINAGSQLNLTAASGISGASSGTYNLTAAGLSGSGTLTNNASGATAAMVVLNGSGTNTFSGTITDNSSVNMVSLSHTGSGTQVLSGNNSYRGTTSVSSGTMLINGNQSSATGAVSVSGTGTLGGTGTTGGAVTVSSGSKLAPGSNGTGNFTVASLTLESGATASFEVNGVSAGSFDSITSTGGTISLDGVFSLTFGSTLANNTSIDLFVGILSGNFSEVNLTGGGYTPGNFEQSGALWTSIQGSQTLTFDASTGILSAAAVPEPGVCGLFLGASGVLLIMRRIKRRDVI